MVPIISRLPESGDCISYYRTYIGYEVKACASDILSREQVFLLFEDDYFPVGWDEPATTSVAPAIADAIAGAVGAR
jgi:hypothetical protein